MASVGDIADLVGVSEGDLAFLSAASDAQRAALATAIEQAGRSRDAELRDAVGNALKFVPRPLRGRIVKMIDGNRRG